MVELLVAISILINSIVLAYSIPSKEEIRELKERVDVLEVDHGLEMSTPKDCLK